MIECHDGATMAPKGASPSVSILPTGTEEAASVLFAGRSAVQAEFRLLIPQFELGIERIRANFRTGIMHPVV